jgi:hypothetical protein
MAGGQALFLSAFSCFALFLLRLGLGLRCLLLLARLRGGLRLLLLRELIGQLRPVLDGDRRQRIDAARRGRKRRYWVLKSSSVLRPQLPSRILAASSAASSSSLGKSARMRSATWLTKRLVRALR